MVRGSQLQLGEVFGPGIQTYFKLLRWLCIVTTCSACSAYAVNVGLALAASTDSRLSSLSGLQSLARVTLWPMQLLVDAASGEASASFGPSGAAARADKTAAVLAMSVLDVAAMLTLFVCLAFYRALEDRTAAEENLASITVDDYSVVLYGLPREPLRGEEVSEFLQAAVPELEGAVADVVVARAYGTYLERVYEALAAEAGVEELDAVAAATGRSAPAKKRTALAARAATLRKEAAALEEPALVAVCAFVTLDTVAARDAVANAFPGGVVRAVMPALARRDAPRFRGRHVLRAAAAGDPSDIFWEHMHVTAAERAGRMLLSGLGTDALLLVTTSLVVGAKTFENGLPPYVACTTATAAGSTLPCAPLFNLSATTADTDPARVLVSQLMGDEDAASCDLFISSSDQFIPDLAPLAPLSVAPPPPPRPPGPPASASALSAAARGAPPVDAHAVACGAAACYGCHWLNVTVVLQ